MSLSPADVQIRLLLADLLKTWGNLPDATTELRAALAGSPSNAIVLRELGKALMMQAQLVEAVQHLRHALLLSPRDPDICLPLASALELLGALSDACTYYEQAQPWHRSPRRSRLPSLTYDSRSARGTA